jgi:hypothetical protein
MSKLSRITLTRTPVNKGHQDPHKASNRRQIPPYVMLPLVRNGGTLPGMTRWGKPRMGKPGHQRVRPIGDRRQSELPWAQPGR